MGNTINKFPYADPESCRPDHCMSEVASQKLSQREKEVICLSIANEYLKLARNLDFTEDEIRNLVYECDQRGKRSLMKYCYKIIHKWEQKKGDSATAECMRNALLKIPRKDIVDQLWNGRVFPSKELSQPIVSEENKAIQNKIEEKQLKTYRDIQMQIAPWIKKMDLPLDKLYVDIELFTTDKHGREDNGKPMNRSEIFNGTPENESPRRILIEGDAGFGKTTFLHKLVDDWVKKERYVFDRFRNVFLLYLRNCQNEQSFKDLMKEEFKHLDVDEEKGLDCIKSFQSETLFLLDGYDELNRDSKKVFEKLLLKQEFENSTVLVTSRRGEFKREIKTNTFTRLSGTQTNQNDDVHFWNKRVLISGIPKINRVLFLKSYFKMDAFDKDLVKFFVLAQRELFRCPLFLILLASLKDEKNIETLDTQTNLYKFIINVMTRRNLIRKRVLLEKENIELFDSNNPNYYVQCAENMKKFGSLALEHLMANKLTFSQEELKNCLENENTFVQLGFLKKRPYYKGRNPKNHYEPLHKSFLEFFAAFALYDSVKNSIDSEQTEFQHKICSLIRNQLQPNKSCLIYPFLAGLLNKQSFLLFESLSRWPHLCNPFEKPFLNILKELNNLEEIKPFLNSFFPLNIEIDSNFKKDSPRFEICSFLMCLYSSSFHFQTVNVFRPYLQMDILIQIKNFEIYVTNNNFSISSQQINLLRIECENLIYNFQNVEKNLSTIWHDAIKIGANIEAKKLYINFLKCSDLIPLLYKELTEGCWSNKSVSELILNNPEAVDENSFDLLTDLIHRKKIENPEIKLLNPNIKIQKNCLERFCMSVLKHVNYINIIMTDNEIDGTIPFHQLCQPDKKWKYIGLSEIFDYSFGDCDGCCSVEEIYMHPFSDIRSFVFVLNHCSGFHSLTCEATNLFSVLSNPCSNLSNVQRICIYYDDFVDCDFSKLSIFSHFRLLSIQFNIIPEISSDKWSIFAQNLALFVKQFRLEALHLINSLNHNQEVLLIILDKLTKEISLQNEMNKSNSHSSGSSQENSRVDLEGFIDLKAIIIDVKNVNNFAGNILDRMVSCLKQLLRQGNVREIVFFVRLFSDVSSIFACFHEDDFLIRDVNDKDHLIDFTNWIYDTLSQLVHKTFIITLVDARQN